MENAIAQKCLSLHRHIYVKPSVVTNTLVQNFCIRTFECLVKPNERERFIDFYPTHGGFNQMCLSYSYYCSDDDFMTCVAKKAANYESYDRNQW